MQLGDIVADRFRLLNHAGKGGTATVFQAFDSLSNSIVALKLFDTQAQTEQIQAEICHREAKALETFLAPSTRIHIGKSTKWQGQGMSL